MVQSVTIVHSVTMVRMNKRNVTRQTKIDCFTNLLFINIQMKTQRAESPGCVE